jgi:hypothetical protein
MISFIPFSVADGQLIHAANQSRVDMGRMCEVLWPEWLFDAQQSANRSRNSPNTRTEPLKPYGECRKATLFWHLRPAEKQIGPARDGTPNV